MRNKHLYINLYINLNSFIKFHVPCFQENLSRKPVGQIFIYLIHHIFFILAIVLSLYSSKCAKINFLLSSDVKHF